MKNVLIVSVLLIVYIYILNELDSSCKNVVGDLNCNITYFIVVLYIS